MSINKDQLVRLIEAVVRKEVKAAMQEVAPKVIKEVMAGMIMEQTVSEEATFFEGNSSKRRRLAESTLERRHQRFQAEVEDDYDDEPVAPRRVPVQEAARPTRRPQRAGLIVPDAMMTENGNAVPVDPNAIPDYIIENLNRDYTDFMRTLPSVQAQRNG